MKAKTLLTAAVALAAICGLAYWKYGDEMEFVLGGAMVNMGYRLQDPIENYDFDHHELSAEQVWIEFLHQNDMAASVRDIWPRTSRHPLVAMVTCMDARLDTAEIAGDTRRYYYVLRLAGSVLEPKEEEMLELAVANGTKVVVFTTHTDCAAEKMAADPNQTPLYPELTAALEQREMRFQEFLNRPVIKERLESKELVVKRMTLDTATDRVVERGK
jgi:carbonic anhydrase